METGKIGVTLLEIRSWGRKSVNKNKKTNLRLPKGKGEGDKLGVWG